LVERDVNNKPLITIHETIPFLMNMYEKVEDEKVKMYDTIRLVLVVLMIFSFIARVVYIEI